MTARLDLDALAAAEKARAGGFENEHHLTAIGARGMALELALAPFRRTDGEG